jgi:predicted PurR-regulated permease PerM
LAPRHAGVDEHEAKVRYVQFTPGLAAVVVTLLLLWLARTVAPVLLLLFLAILLAVFLDALRDALVRWLHIRPKAAFPLAMAIMALVLYGIGALLVPPLVAQTRELLERLPQYASAWQSQLSGLVTRFPALEPYIGKDRQADLINTAVDKAEQFVAGVLPHAFDLVTGFIDSVSVLVMGLYLALRPATYENAVLAVTPPRYREGARDVLHALGETLRKWSLAQLLAMTILGLLTAGGLLVLGVPYALTFGIFSGIAAIVPFFGTLVSTLVPALFVLGGSGGPGGAALVLLLGVVVHLIEGNVLSPLVMQRGVHIPPVFSIMAVLIMGKLLGPIGLLVAVPFLAVIMVIVRKVLIERVYAEQADQAAIG